MIHWREGPQNSSCDIPAVCLISSISLPFHRMRFKFWLYNFRWLWTVQGGEKQETKKDNIGGIYVGNEY